MKSLALALLLASGWVGAQTNTTWYAGSLSIQNGQLLDGELAFQTKDFVLFKSGDKVNVYPAFQVRWFRFYDNEMGFNREFMTIRQPLQGHHIFEMVLWGKVNVVRELKKSNLNNNPVSHVDDFNYYTYNNGQLTRLKKFKQSIYPALKSRFDDFPELIKEAQLNPADEADAIRIAQLFNQLSRDRIVAANH